MKKLANLFVDEVRDFTLEVVHPICAGVRALLGAKGRGTPTQTSV